jgi:glucan phosphoethanolaminetransferase (alkaline phosphatase superfamily)
MNERSKEEARSFKGLAMFFVIWALIPAALAFAVVRLFDRLSKHDLLTILLVCLVALIVAVGGGMIMAIRNSRQRLRNENRFD